MHMDDPIAFFLTMWVTYGTWLPGDARGWVEYPARLAALRPGAGDRGRGENDGDACRLSALERDAVQRQIAETCVSVGGAFMQ